MYAEKKEILGMHEEWSNNACLGYMAKALEASGYGKEEIRGILETACECFDTITVGEAEEYFERWDF